MKLSRTLALAGFLFLGACASTGDAKTPPCTCGTLATAVSGCHHPLCAAGKTNPDNINCHCGPISVPKTANGGN